MRRDGWRRCSTDRRCSIMKNKDIIIDHELESLLPPLNEEENTELLRNIAKDGFTDPIIVWLNNGTLVDGHNRHRIWRDVYARDEDKAPQIVEMQFASRDDVKEFMLKRQLGRRNLTDAMRVKIALQLRPMIAAKAKAKQVRKPADSVRLNSDEQPIRVDEEIAKAAGVSRDTVRKVEAVLGTDDESQKQNMLTGNTSINKAHKAMTAAPSKRPLKPLRPSEVDRVKGEIWRDVKALIARAKRTPPETIEAMQSLASHLTTLSDELRTLASEVTEKIGGGDEHSRHPAPIRGTGFCRRSAPRLDRMGSTPSTCGSPRLL